MKSIPVHILFFIALIFSPIILIAEEAEPFIFNGKQSAQGSRLWQVALVKVNNDPRKYCSVTNNWEAQFCGGTLINNQWVLTAAHCLKGKTINDFCVLINTHDLHNGGERIKISEAVPYKTYNPDNKDNDIALIKLEKQVNIRAIKLIKPSDSKKLYPPGTKSIAIGWGDTAANPNIKKYPSKLMETTLPIVSSKECKFRFDKLNYDLTDNMLCAGFIQGNTNFCYGDSGGPLIVSDLQKSFVQVGIISWLGKRKEGCALPGRYGVYTRLANYVEWIKDIAKTTCSKEEIATNKC